MVKVNSGTEAVLCEIPDSVPAQLENQISLLRLVHVARKLQPGDPSTEEILAAIGALAAGSEQRMQVYHRMFQQEATHAYKEKIYESELVCKHDALSIRAQGQTFHALQVLQKIHKIDLTALGKIIFLITSCIIGNYPFRSIMLNVSFYGQ